MDTRKFEGDLLLHETPDGGDCILEDDLLKADHAFGTAFYISLFGGNKADAGKVKTNKTWWGNTISGTTENEKIVSRFQNHISTMPMTVKNMKDAETKAALDLHWAIDEGIVDEIVITSRAEKTNYMRLFIEAKKAGDSIFETDYGVLWGAGLNGV